MTTAPFKTSELLDYIRGWRPGAIDLSMSHLHPFHLWNYLSFLKVADRVTNPNEEQLTAYMVTRDLVRVTGMTQLMQHALYYVRFRTTYSANVCEWSDDRLAAFVDANEDMLCAHCLVLKALPALLSKSRGGTIPLMQGEDSIFHDVGVNFVHVFEDPLFLISLVPEALAQDIAWTPYYKPHFEHYMYGGDNLIWFVNANPDNLLFQAML